MLGLCDTEFIVMSGSVAAVEVSIVSTILARSFPFLEAFAYPEIAVVVEL